MGILAEIQNWKRIDEQDNEVKRRLSEGTICEIRLEIEDGNSFDLNSTVGTVQSEGVFAFIEKLNFQIKTIDTDLYWW